MKQMSDLYSDYLLASFSQTFQVIEHSHLTK